VEKIQLKNGFIELKSPGGVKDTRTGVVHPAVICDKSKEEFFVDAVEQQPAEEVVDDPVEEAAEEPVEQPKKGKKKASAK